MVIEWASILLVAALLFVSLFSIKILERKTNISAELKRKAFHVSMGIVMLIFPYIFESVYSVGVLGIIALVILFILKNTRLKKSIGSVIYSVDRESMGEIFFVISVFLIFYLSKGDKVLYSVPILILTFADTVAALIGKRYGKNNLAEANEDTKSLEGSFMFFMIAFMATLVPLLLYTTVGREEVLIISTIIGFNVSLIEMISHTGNDNLLIPLTSYAFLATLINANVFFLRRNLIILGVIFFLVMIANRIKAWSKLALVEILVVGYLTMLLFGPYAIIPPAMLFLLSLRLPKLRENEKSYLFDSRIIETNVLVGIVICGIVAVTGLKKELFMVYSTCFAMHMAINTFIRLRYYFKLSNISSVLLSTIKGIACIFIPGIVLQKIFFKELIDIKIIVLMCIAILVSSIAISIQKKDVEKEEVNIKNGFMQMKIVGVISTILGIIQII